MDGWLAICHSFSYQKTPDRGLFFIAPGKRERMRMKDFLKAAVENGVFFAQFMGIVVLIFAIAWSSERFLIQKEGGGGIGSALDIRKISIIGIFSAISFVIMLFDVPVPFAPAFYKIDLSEVPVLIVGFSLGPVAGVLTEFVKIMLKLLFRSTTTAFVGELANFIVGCTLILPASIIYFMNKSKRTAMIGCAVGVAAMTAFGVVFNELYLLPTFAKLYGMPMEALIKMGTAVNPAIVNVRSFVLLTVLPLNLLKGAAVSVIVVSLYKSLRTILDFSRIRGTAQRNVSKQ